jgi:uncharacterized glyoxalase superfamily protein PhnB
MPPEGYHSVTPRIVVEDPEATFAFLQAVFDAEGEVRPGQPIEARIGDSLIMVSGVAERSLFPAFLYVYVDDADTRYAKAIAEGAVSIEAPMNTPYGDRRGMVQDPAGNVFQIAHRLPG